MALSRVQTTPKITGASVDRVAAIFTTPPTVGNGIIVLATEWGGGAPSGASDNYGNAYTVGPTFAFAGIPRVSVLYCPKITASGAGFTVTPVDGFTYWTVVAIEVAGVAGGLVLDQFKTQGGTSTTPATGLTPALTADEVFLVALHALNSGQISITVETVSPAWVRSLKNSPVRALREGRQPRAHRRSSA
jgi:hypothetical protein